MLMDTGSDTSVVSKGMATKMGVADEVRECGCTVRTLTGVKPLTGEVTLELGHLTGRRVSHNVHVADIESTTYDIIIGSDVMDLVGCKIATRKKGWTVDIGRKKFKIKGMVCSGKHALVSAAVRETNEHKVIREIEEALEQVLAREDEELPATGRVLHTIETTDERPVWVPYRRYPHAQMDIIRAEVQGLLKGGIIRPSKSTYNSPLWVVPKSPGPNGEPRFRVVVDYRALNLKTKPDKYPLPLLDAMLDRMSGARYFSTLDLKSGYHQIRMHPRDAGKTAFTFDRGHYEFTRMPFGLRNAPSTFQRLMDEFLEGLEEEWIQVYMDDLVIFSKNIEEHRDHLIKVIRRLKEFNLRVSVDKKQLGKREVRFMGHILSESGVRPNPDKIKAIAEVPVPKDVKELRGFLGMANYYRKFIQGFADKAEPLTALTKKGVRWGVGERELESFQALKKAMSEAPVLRFPELNRPFLLTTDASQVAAGAVLSQITEDGDHPVAYASFKFTETETRYSAIERELLAMVRGVEQFRPYLWGTEFTIRTDHKPLLWVETLKESSARMTKLKERLTPYTFHLQHVKGTQNVVADCLSRNVNAVEGQPGSSDQTQGGESAVVRYLREWAENGPDFPTVENTRRTPESTSPRRPQNQEENPTRKWETREGIINDKINQVLVITGRHTGVQTALRKYHTHKILTLSIGVDVSDAEWVGALNQTLDYNSKYFVHIDTPELKQRLIRLYEHKKFLTEGQMIECLREVRTVEVEEEQRELVWSYHIGKTNHRGVTETLAQLRRKYYWINMPKMVGDTLTNCETCAKAKYVRRPTEAPQVLTPTPGEPLERVQTDIFFYEGRIYLTVVDEATRAGFVQRIARKTAACVTRALLGYFALLGCPKQIIMDQGREFQNRAVRDLAAELDIKLHFTTPGHSRSHGMVERFHSTLLEHLHLLKIDKGLSGEEAITRATLAYNSSIHTATRRTPHEGLVLRGNRGPREDEILQARRETDVEYQEIGKRKRIEKANRRPRVEGTGTLGIGQTVYRKNPCRRRKEDDRFLGPYEVIKLLERNRVQIVNKNSRSNRQVIVHRNELRVSKRYRTRREETGM